MTPQQQLWIDQTADFVKHQLADAEGGHDWWHIRRVWKTSINIGRSEEGVDMCVIQLSALLHDIADAKFHNGNEEIGPEIALLHLSQIGVDQKTIDHVINIIRHMSFKSSLGIQAWSSHEMQCVQDADRLDAIGAIGIARAFNYGGYKNRTLYHPDIPPRLNMTKEEYKTSTAPTINHFYEKLLLLKDKMNTASGRRLAQDRHIFMEDYLRQFYQEWNGEA